MASTVMTFSGAPWMRRFHAILALGFAGFALVNLVAPRDSVDHALGAVQLAFAIFWGILAARPPRATVTDDAVTFRNRWRSQRFVWTDIKAVDVISVTGRGLPIVRTHDGDSWRVHAALSTAAHPRRADDFATEIRRRLT